MPSMKQVIGGPLVVGRRQLSLSRAIRAGDFAYLTPPHPLRAAAPLTTDRQRVV